jgi:hypothetical protein
MTASPARLLVSKEIKAVERNRIAVGALKVIGNTD